MQRYHVVQKIGAGAHGSAYVVVNKGNVAEKHVLKKIKVDGAADSDRPQAELEVKLLLRLDHPFVLRYADHFFYKDHLCIITEWCEAGDLHTYLQGRRQPVPEPQVHEWLAQITLAVQHVHSRYVLHRDLKTQNIFLTNEGHIKLGDFGIARMLSGTTEFASTVIGTPCYMSPEVIQNQPYGYRSDMWSLGCVLHEIMSLQHAFDADGIGSLAGKILQGEHVHIPTIYSLPLQDLVKVLLSHDPKSRPTCEEVLGMPFLQYAVQKASSYVAEWKALKDAGAHSACSVHHVSPGSMPLHSGKAHGTGPHGMPVLGERGSNSTVDSELHAAKERLRMIDMERHIVREQVQRLSMDPPGAMQQRSSLQVIETGHTHSTINPASSMSDTATYNHTRRAGSCTQLSSYEAQSAGALGAAQRLSGFDATTSSSCTNCHEHYLARPQRRSCEAMLQAQCQSSVMQHQRQFPTEREQLASSKFLPRGADPIAAIELMLRDDLPRQRGIGMHYGHEASTPASTATEVIGAYKSHYSEQRTGEGQAWSLQRSTSAEGSMTCGFLAEAPAVAQPLLSRGPSLVRSVPNSRRVSGCDMQVSQGVQGRVSSSHLEAFSSGSMASVGRPPKATPPKSLHNYAALSAPSSTHVTTAYSAQHRDAGACMLSAGLTHGSRPGKRTST